MNYNRPKCGGAIKKRKKMFSSRTRGKRRTQVHQNSRKNNNTVVSTHVATPEIEERYLFECFNQTLMFFQNTSFLVIMLKRIPIDNHH